MIGRLRRIPPVHRATLPAGWSGSSIERGKGTGTYRPMCVLAAPGDPGNRNMLGMGAERRLARHRPGPPFIGDRRGRWSKPLLDMTALPVARGPDGRILPGHSGNPSGRPIGSISDFRRRFEPHMGEVAEVLLELLRSPNENTRL